jgi:hypothetical protein
MHTVAGGGSCSAAAPAALSGGSCDNVSATSATIGEPGDVAALPGGGFLYVDSAGQGTPPFGYEFVREVTPKGKVVTVAGNGTDVDAPDGTPATASGLDGPVAVAPLPDGSFLITEKDSSEIRMVSPGPPGVATITTIAGTGTPGFNGDGVGTSSRLSFPTEAEPQADGSVLIDDAGNERIRVLSAAAPGATLTTIAGGGSCDDVITVCDGLSAGAVELNDPVSVSPIQGGTGGYLIAEGFNSVSPGGDAIREVLPSGEFVTVAGQPGIGRGYTGDGGPAVFAHLANPERVLSTPDGGFLIADTDNSVVRQVSPAGIITTVAGDGVPSYAGDNGPATAASLNGPVGVSPTTNGGLLVADASDPAIREVTLAPTTTVTLSPATANGAGGWYIGTVVAKVSAKSVTATGCELDPSPPAPTVFDELTSPCPFSGAGATVSGDGVHLLYVASVNSFGDKETPVAFPIDIDSTPPGIRCKAHQSFRAGKRGRVTATVTDSISGPAAPVVSARANTRRVGVHTVTLVGLNHAGLADVTHCRYTVVAVRLKPAPALRWAFATVGASTSVRRLVVSDVAANAEVNLTCQGSGCPFSSATDVTGARCGSAPCQAKAKDRQRRRTVDLTQLLSGVKLGTGARLTVSVTKTNAVGGVWVFTIRAGRAPTHQISCLEPGSSVPGKGCASAPR